MVATNYTSEEELVDDGEKVAWRKVAMVEGAIDERGKEAMKEVTVVVVESVAEEKAEQGAAVVDSAETGEGRGRRR